MVSSLVTLASFLAATAMALPGAVNPPTTRATSVEPLTWDALDAQRQNDPSTFQSYQTGGLVRATLNNETSALAKRCAASATFTWGDIDNGGPGVIIGNAGTDYRFFYFYENSCDSVPYKYTELAPGEFAYFSFPALWAGRLTRGVNQFNLDGQPQLLATWFEFSFDVNNWIWGDISLIRGCDGPAVLYSTDGSGAWKGWNSDIISNAPSGALAYKADGALVIENTENLDGSINTIPRDWELSQVGSDYVYVDDYHGNPVITSTNGRFGIGLPDGRP
ncbi:hypothetical protein BX600DRAFT_471693 [Xylariales sp. PMI_506]|nr:hypothetical protein BX600DRAFT_471693 [Xylariales sp. PMI_506]